VKSVSPMTFDPRVMSTTTKLSDEIDRRLTASAGYDSLVQFHCLALVGLGAVHEPVFGEQREDLLHVLAAEALARPERQLERGALDVIEQDVQVVGVDERVLGRGVEEVRRVADHELVDGRAARHQHRGRPARPAPGAARALPGGRDGARVARPSPHVERADVDAELERVGRDDRAHGALAQAALDLAPPLRQVAAAIAAHALGPPGGALSKSSLR
jgi:hypothetical protein